MRRRWLNCNTCNPWPANQRTKGHCWKLSTSPLIKQAAQTTVLSRSHGLPLLRPYTVQPPYTIGEKYRQEGANAQKPRTLQQCNCEQRLLLLGDNSRSSTPLTDSHVQHKLKQYRQLCCGEKSIRSLALDSCKAVL